MTPPDPAAEARRWLTYAEEDLESARTMVAQHRPPRQACWLAQQAAEKAIKSALVFEQVEFPKTHDLDALRGLVPDGWTVIATDADLAALTEWSVESRYPGNWPEATGSDASAAIAGAAAVVEAVRTDLNLRSA
jgi:HEPN domain-containing protein